MKTPRSIVAWMVFAIVAIGAIAYWDEQREATAALDDFAREQRTVADAAAAAFEHADGTSAASPQRGLHHNAASLRQIEDRNHVVILVQTSNAFETTSGTEVRIEPIARAVDSGKEAVRLTHAEAAQLGLPARTAMAGIASVTVPGVGERAIDGTSAASPQRGLHIIVVASALRERDREIRAEWRLVLGFFLASGLVLGFGALALKKQRKELELSRELAIADAVRARDDRLVKADKLATLGALATGIAHEVSTPLGVIVGRAEQLAPRVADDERARRAVAAISEQADRIGAIVRGFLALARGEAVAFEHVDPCDIAADAVELVQHRFQKAHAVLDVRQDEALPKIACDPKLFTQVLVNLLLNACDACDAGGEVELAVSKNDSGVVFVVTDTGAGITEEAAARATEPFFTTKSPGKGTGLGLAIANEIVNHHRGRLSISPRTDGRGTVARVEISGADGTSAASPQRGRNSGEGAGGGLG